MVDWPDSLIDAVARRRAIVVLGAGCSFHATPHEGSTHPPDWNTFLNQAAEKVSQKPRTEAKRLIKAGDYLSACEIIKTNLGGDWLACVENAFGAQRLDPGRLHTLVYELDLPIVMTTNFDRVYQNAANFHSAGTAKVKNYADSDLALLAKGNSKSRIVLRVHGSVDDVGSMIFTRSDYIRLRNEYPLFQRVMGALAVTNTLLFIGCSLKDPDMILMLEDLASLSRGFGEHFCLIDSRQSKEISRVYQDCFGLRSITYKYDVNHSEIVVSLEALLNSASKRRGEMAGSSQW